MSGVLHLFRSIRLSYLPILLVYLAVGLSGLSSVTSTFFIRDQISLTAAQLISLGILASLPWSAKLSLGTLVDAFPLGRDGRRGYIYLGQALVVLGTLLTVDHASTRHLITLLGEYSALLVSGLLTAVGVVLSDIAADTMAIEITDDPVEIGMIQTLTRVAQATGALLGAAVTGYLATHYSASTVYSLLLLCPGIALIGTFLAPVGSRRPEAGRTDWRVLLGGVAYAGTALGSNYLFPNYGNLITFLASSVMLTYLFSRMQLSRPFILAMLGLFLYRVSPGIGPGLSWYYTSELGFTPEFLGHLSLVAAIASVVILVLLARVISSGRITTTLGWIAGLAALFSLPDLVIYFNVAGLREYARELTLLDSSALAPLANLSMIPLGIVVARVAPATARATYMALTASLMNLALVGGDVGTQLLNLAYPVTRGDYSNLGTLMLVSLSLGVILSIVAVVVLHQSEVTGERREG